MTATSSTPSRSPRGGVARSGANGKGKTAEFRGLTLVLPKEPSGEVWFAIEDDNISDLIRALVGEEQYVKVREKCLADKLNLKQVRTQLRQLGLDILRDAYGLDSGE